MTDDWDFYPLRVDDEPASIFVDLGIQANAPVASLSYMNYVRLYMNQPRPDGLSSNEEFDTLVEIEKAMEAKLCGDEVGYVGRNTSGGCRDFYFYAATADDWQGKVSQVLSAFDDYKYETGTREDGEWSTYLNFLLPSDLDRQRIENRRVCQTLEHHGDKLVAEREIHHWSYFESPIAVDAYVSEISANGFQVRGRPIRDEGRLRYGVQVFRVDIPSYSNIDAVTIPLFEAALSHGGDYDGWECVIQG
jgi:hypothetical protein